jgi:MFS family permease
MHMNPVIAKVGLISFFADLSSELLYPVTPVFLAGVLGASMTSIGIIEGCAEFTASLLKTWAGSHSDRTGSRKPFVWGGYLVSTLSKASIGLATAWPGVLISRCLDRVGKGIRTAPRDALIAESVPKEQLGLAFGIHRGMDTLGAVLGPVIAIFLLQAFGTERLRIFYFLSLIPGLFAVALAFRLPERVRTANRTIARAGLRLRASLRELPRSYFVFISGWAIFSMGNSSDAFLILKTGDGNSLARTVMAYCLFNLVYAISSPVIGRASDRFGKQMILQASLGVFAFVYAGFGLGWSPWILFPAYGLFMGMSEGVAKACVAEHVPEGRAGELGATAQGFFGMVTGFSSLAASVVAGLLWDGVGSGMPFFYGSGMALLAWFVFRFAR